MILVEIVNVTGCVMPYGDMLTDTTHAVWFSYPPLSVGVRPKRVHRPTDMSNELRTVTTAARARPHLDLTMSILPVGAQEEGTQ